MQAAKYAHPVYKEGHSGAIIGLGIAVIAATLGMVGVSFYEILSYADTDVWILIITTPLDLWNIVDSILIICGIHYSSTFYHDIRSYVFESLVFHGIIVLVLTGIDTYYLVKQELYGALALGLGVSVTYYACYLIMGILFLNYYSDRYYIVTDSPVLNPNQIYSSTQLPMVEMKDEEKQ